MKRSGSWFLWAGLTAVLWSGWVIGVYTPLRRQDQHWTGQSAQIDHERSAALGRLRIAPVIAAQADTLAHELNRIVATIPNSSAVQEFLSAIVASGQRCCAGPVEANPELQSMMTMSKGADAGQSSDPVVDTLAVELTAAGDLRAIGTWLDQVEHEPAFQQWVSCRWNRGEGDGGIGFAGKALFWVSVSPEND
ncbi:MAG: hypothetical protein HY304_09030 [candidate division Zixibacteria bacterium]|nr:hypothetical protein [candidate division Zixibacteria bacterium]